MACKSAVPVSHENNDSLVVGRPRIREYVNTSTPSNSMDGKKAVAASHEEDDFLFQLRLQKHVGSSSSSSYSVVPASHEYAHDEDSITDRECASHSASWDSVESYSSSVQSCAVAGQAPLEGLVILGGEYSETGLTDGQVEESHQKKGVFHDLQALRMRGTFVGNGLRGMVGMISDVLSQSRSREDYELKYSGVFGLC
ncbi:hypothetical protein R1flu_019818 [Riccia fluitans]|uniref:Uncharacterized protein n=1 Tax=Riccia fluitans TaxID=41844 RepID=A0ABD1ZJR0_9MARC